MSENEKSGTTTVEDTEFPQRIGESSWYLLSDGNKVQGEEEALGRQIQLDSGEGSPASDTTPIDVGGDIGGATLKPVGGLDVDKVDDLLEALGTFRKGDRKDFRIAKAQLLLGQFGHYTRVDGLFGGSTEQAVVEFQEKVRIDATGEIDQKTWKALLLRHP